MGYIKKKLYGGCTGSKPPLKPYNKIIKFIYFTESLILRGAELHPTNGWKTYRIKDLTASLKDKKFDYNKLIADLKIKHGETIFSEFVNPMKGLNNARSRMY